MKEVSGIAELRWSVLLPDDHQYNEDGEGRCNDPVIEAVLDAMPQMIRVALRENETTPFEVYFELHEEDCEIEDDLRDERTIETEGGPCPQCKKPIPRCDCSPK